MRMKEFVRAQLAHPKGSRPGRNRVGTGLSIADAGSMMRFGRRTVLPRSAKDRQAAVSKN